MTILTTMMKSTHSWMGHYFFSYLLTWEVDVIEILEIMPHTIRKCQKMARQNTFEILLLNDANMIGEH